MPGRKASGVLSCMVFAASLIEGERRMEECPPLPEGCMEEKLEELRELGL